MLSFQQEFSYIPLYLERLEDVLTRCRNLLVANHLFEALYASVFVYDNCSNIVQAISDYRAPKQNFCMPLKASYLFPYWTSMASSGLHFQVFSIMKLFLHPKSSWLSLDHIFRQRLDHKPTIQEWIAFSFCGPVKFHAPVKSNHQSWVPLLTNVSLTTDVHGYNQSHVVFNELGMPKASVRRLSLQLLFHVRCACSYFQLKMLVTFILWLS